MLGFRVVVQGSGVEGLRAVEVQVPLRVGGPTVFCPDLEKKSLF